MSQPAASATAKTRVAILGGGIAGLTAAHELSKTAALRARYQVDVYQLGFRLGGKLASGRDAEQGRNLEHGLHVWFGCYENAFGLLRELYRDWQRDPRSPLQCWTDAIAPRAYVPIGDDDGEDFVVHHREWLVVDGMPGDGEIRVSLALLLSHLDDILRRPRWLASLRRRFGARLSQRWLEPSLFLGVARPSAASARGERPATGHALARALLRLTRRLIRRQGERERAQERGTDPATARRREGERVYAELLVCVVLGLLDPRFGVVHGEGLESLNAWDFRDWLAEVGASRACRDSTFVATLYEAAFSTVDGDAEALSMEAGTAVNVLLRLSTYKGSILWEVRAGMGDVLIAPLYELLRDRGVRFHFFHKVTNLGLSADKTRIARVELGVQAKTKGAYQPLMQHEFMAVWPCAPRWEQLEGGDALREREVDFESHWCREPFANTVALHWRRDFDALVLALPLGAFKPLNAEPGPCRELIAHNDRFARMVRALHIVPTQALQLWLDRDLAELGPEWRALSETTAPIMVNSPKPYTAWADMTSLLQLERWKAAPPRSLHYLCGMLTTDLHTRPVGAEHVEMQARALARAQAHAWLTRHALRLWPGLRVPGSAELDWSALHAPAGVTGEARLDAQYFRANVNPGDCTVAVAAGTSRFRLGADESGFSNLYLAGAWTRTPLFVECVEGAVMSGKAAARAILQQPLRIPGEGWLWSDARHVDETCDQRSAAE